MAKNKEIKALLKALEEIQSLAGSAKGGYLDDRSPDRYEKVVPPLDRIFDICVRERSKYYPCGE